MQVCPKCNKKLISHASARCNWCGSLIEDPEYQAQATSNREAYLAQQALHDQRALAWQRSAVGIGPLGDPIFGAPLAPRPIPIQADQMTSARRAVVRAQQLGTPRSQPDEANPANAPSQPGEPAVEPAHTPIG